MLSVDGVPPRAKMAQQRQRRYKNQPKELIGTMNTENPKSEQEEEEDDEEEISPLDFDSQSITPGTQFMKRLGDALDNFVEEKIQKDPTWQKFTVIYSGPDVIKCSYKQTLNRF
jgi:5'-3' exoribonuclease 1